MLVRMSKRAKHCRDAEHKLNTLRTPYSTTKLWLGRLRLPTSGFWSAVGSATCAGHHRFFLFGTRAHTTSPIASFLREEAILNCSDPPDTARFSPCFNVIRQQMQTLVQCAGFPCIMECGWLRSIASNAVLAFTDLRVQCWCFLLASQSSLSHTFPSERPESHSSARARSQFVANTRSPCDVILGPEFKRLCLEVHLGHQQHGKIWRVDAGEADRGVLPIRRQLARHEVCMCTLCLLAHI